MCGRQNNAHPKDVHVLIHGTCECVALHGKRVFAGVIKIEDLLMERGASSIYLGPT